MSTSGGGAGRTARLPILPVDMSDDPALEAAKLESLAEFAAGAGHEINNPIAAIKGRAQLLLLEETDPRRRKMLLTIGAQADRVRDMIADLMLFARPPQPEPQPEPLEAALRDVAGRFTEELRSRRLSLGWQLEEDVSVWADPTQLRVVISELLRNAMRFSPEGGTIEIRWGAERQGESTQGVFSISDAGPGLTEQDRAHLFDPFYSGRQAGRGLGFGLCKCWRIVTMHGGEITPHPREPQGLTMTVHWPTPEHGTQEAEIREPGESEAPGSS